MKRVAVLYSEYSPTIDAIKYRLEKLAEVETFSSTKDINFGEYDYVVLSKFNGEIDFDAINLHQSLLPAFNSTTPVKDAILAGVKLTGLTIYHTKPFKILAQYPVFINNSTHFYELNQELEYLEQTIYPLVLEKVLKNEPFEIQTLMSQKSGCSGSCKECGGCKN